MALSVRLWQGAPRPLIVAHRGAARAAPENTLAAFRAAMYLGADGIEFDVQRTADGALVIMHDSTLERTTSGRGRLPDWRLSDLKALDAGSWFRASAAGERIPTLDETIAAVPAPARLFAEIKQGPAFDEGIAGALADRLGQLDTAGRCEVSSFDHPSLKQFRAAAPNIPTGILYSARLIDPVAAAGLAGAQALHPDWELIAPDLVPLAHSHGLAVVTWTVNAADQMERLAAMEVDAIITDLPDLARRVLGR